MDRHSGQLGEELTELGATKRSEDLVSVFWSIGTNQNFGVALINIICT
jgi:hypothetical protein